MNCKERVLVVDDDEPIRRYLSHYLSSRGYKVESLSSGASVIERLKSSSLPGVILLDLMMPEVCGLDVLTEMRKLHSRVPTIVISAVGQVSTVVSAMQLGACNYLVKPLEEQALDQAVEAALHNGSQIRKASCSEAIWTGKNVRDLEKLALQIADTNVPVLIVGESGVGKDVAARLIHSASSRRNEPFVKVNCAALPGDLLESEFFGHESGAFTGAVHEKPGRFELAGKGTIVLDEIGEMSCHLQAKLLHVLQDGEYTRLGGVRPRNLQARVLALTNKNLLQAISAGEFRRDLYFRLNVVRLALPPLRERAEDIPALCARFLQKYSEEYHRAQPEISASLMHSLCTYSWPGNIRELENVIRRFVIVPDEKACAAEITEQFLIASEIPRLENSLREYSTQITERAEKELVFRTLKEVNWNRKRAAQKLNICYKSLLNKLKRWEEEQSAAHSGAG